MAAVHELLKYVRPFIIEVDAVDIAARHHDVFNRGGFEIEYAEQHLLMLLRNHGARFLDHGTQFFTAQGLARAFQFAHAENGQHAVRHPVQGRHEWPQYELQGPQDERGRESNAFRVNGSEGFGHYLGKHQQNGGQDRARHEQRMFAPQLQGHDRRYLCDYDVDEVVAEQQQADQAVRTFEQFLCRLRGAVAALGEVLQAITIERHHGGLGTREERRDQDQ